MDFTNIDKKAGCACTQSTPQQISGRQKLLEMEANSFLSDKKYRPMPVWSWNDFLDKEKTSCHIDEMDKTGLGGFIIHADSGLETEYMGEEWYKNIEACLNDGNKRALQVWLCDENGSPSGFGNGSINSRGLDFQQKQLRFEAGEKTNDRTITYKDGYHFYYDVNPFYVDTLDIKVTTAFIKEIYEPYFARFGSAFEGFYTKEPQLSCDGIPWSFMLPEEYKKEYGEELLERLIELFRPVGDFENTRFKFWKLVTKLFSQNFIKPIQDWCTAHNLKFSGHLSGKKAISQQLITSGACMPHYEHFDIPAIACYGRDISNCLIPLQASSVAHQLGKKEVFAELFECYGHNINFDEMKKISQWHLVHGITKLCPHIQGYSLRGHRKHSSSSITHLASQQSCKYTDFISRAGMLLSEGEVKFDTLLLHPQTSSWVSFNGENYDEVNEYGKTFSDAVSKLEKKHVLFHLGDETIIENHACIEGNELVIGTQRYKQIVVPSHKYLFPSTAELLSKFESVGGTILSADEVCENDICSDDRILYTMRVYDNFNLHYFVNSSDEEFTAEITRGSYIIDLFTGEKLPFYGVYKFRPNESIAVIESDLPPQSRPFKKALKTLSIDDLWKIENFTPNTLTIDKCDVYFDDEVILENENASDVIYIANECARDIKIRCEYKFNIEEKPEELFLVCETPSSFEIKINGLAFKNESEDCFIDNSLKKLLISDFVTEGVNIISFETNYSPSPEFLNNTAKAKIFESEKNKLAPPFEIESIYIVGDFSVKTDGNFLQLDKNAIRYVGDFAITKAPNELKLSNLEQHGFPFFAGKITFSKNYNLSDTGYALRFSKKGISCVCVLVNGQKAGELICEPYECDISQFLQKGDNEIKITLVNNLRNLFGPHHLPIGEASFVDAGCFVKRPCAWNMMKGTPWEENYCLAEFGIESKAE